jgi:hypothetical protein
MQDKTQEEQPKIDKPRQWDFSIFEEEIVKIEEWQKKHDKKCPYYKNSGAIGGRMTYSFTGTSIGGIVKVKCACGEEFDATDYSSW